jgi:23S rRNA (cytidine2498-2'-O)-methyltransferase
MKSKHDDWLHADGGWIGTSNRGSAQYAVEELRRMFPTMKFVYLVPAEVFRFIVSDMHAEEVVSQILSNEPIFLRHLQPVDAAFERSDSEASADLQRLQEAVIGLGTLSIGDKVAVQVRKTEASGFGLSSSEVKRALDDAMVSRIGVEPVVRDADWIVSVYVTEQAVFTGVSRPEHNLSDWPGGMIRFRHEDEQISRAKFKLLEAERVFGLDFTAYRSAIDLGAAPGGWTSLLLERGLHVTAIDPGALHPSLKGHPKLTFLKRNAADVKLEEGGSDLLVCDMSWNPKMTGKLLKDLLYALQTGGSVIMTVKLMHGKPFQTIKEVIRELSPDLTLQRAKQLFHNREELTLFLVKTG